MRRGSKLILCAHRQGDEADTWKAPVLALGIERVRRGANAYVHAEKLWAVPCIRTALGNTNREVAFENDALRPCIVCCLQKLLVQVPLQPVCVAHVAMKWLVRSCQALGMLM